MISFRTSHFALILLLASYAAAQAPATFERGVVIPRVTCLAEPEQSYSLYLPSNYTTERKWPVLFAFDPVANGSTPVTLAKEAAEKYGYIVAASNNSRNGPWEPQRDAARAMMHDVADRFAMDNRRVYATGFSGGSRVATTVALLCGDCLAGIFAQGAGLPGNAVPSSDITFSYFATVGESDFNYAEMFELAGRFEELSLPVRLRVFDGPHRWAPPEVWLEALAWLQVRAMKEGRRPKDGDWLATELARVRERMEGFEKAGDLYAAFCEYRSLAREWDGLVDVAPFKARLAELQSSDAVRDRLQQEERDIRRQRSLSGPFFSGFEMLRKDPSTRLSARSQIFSILRNIRSAQGKAEKRALDHVFAYAYETGEGALREKDYSFAVMCFDFAAEARPETIGPPYGLARAYAGIGRKKQALNALRDAVRKGLRSAKVLRATPEFASLQSDAKFQEIVKSLETESPQS